jgi:hypothetical protein
MIISSGRVYESKQISKVITIALPDTDLSPARQWPGSIVFLTPEELCRVPAAGREPVPARECHVLPYSQPWVGVKQCKYTLIFTGKNVP